MSLLVQLCKAQGGPSTELYLKEHAILKTCAQIFSKKVINLTKQLSENNSSAHTFIFENVHMPGNELN